MKSNIFKINYSLRQPVKSSPIKAVYFPIILGNVFLLFALLGLQIAHITIPQVDFLPVHLILEFFSVVVSFAIFITGWFAYKQTQNSQDLIIGLTFLAVGLFDFIHALSYPGMPDFLGINSVGKAASFWIISRMSMAIGLLVASTVSIQFKNKVIRSRYIVFIVSLLLLLIISLFTVYGNFISNLLYDTETKSLTDFKISLEILIICLYIAAFFAVNDLRLWSDDIITLLRCSLIVTIFCEICFTMYSKPFDWINLIGHVLKSVSSFIILNALFVSSLQRPYLQLSSARDRLQEMYLDSTRQRKELEKSFTQIGNALSSSLRLTDTLQLISELSSEILNADCAVAIMFKEQNESQILSATQTHCTQCTNPNDTVLHFEKTMERNQKSIRIDDIDYSGHADRNCDSMCSYRSFLGARMFNDNLPVGIIGIFSLNSYKFSNEDIELLESFAAHASIAINNSIKFERESRISDILQRSILGSYEINDSTYEIAHIYKPALSEALVGGDFYDIVATSDDKIGIILGDVSGKGLMASIHTAMTKYSLRAYLMEGHSPASALTLLNRNLNQLTDPETFVTVFLGMLDKKTGVMTYSNAGHEPPVLAKDKTYELLMPTGAAVGFGFDSHYNEQSVDLTHNSILLLYTDGISEARNDKNFFGTEGIGEILLNNSTSSSKEIVETLYKSAFDYAGGTLHDDVAIVAVKTI